MSQIANKNTMQNPMSTVAVNGAQLIQLVPGSRLYLKAPDVSPTLITTKSNGATPGTYVDTGIIEAVKPGYKKTLERVETGIDQVLQTMYSTKTEASIMGDLLQFDYTVLNQVSGITPSLVSASIYSFPLGSETVVQQAVLLVSQNKIDGKEMQFYNPSAFVSFDFNWSDKKATVKVNIELPLFTMAGSSQVMALTIFP